MNFPCLGFKKHFYSNQYSPHTHTEVKTPHYSDYDDDYYSKHLLIVRISCCDGTSPAWVINTWLILQFLSIVSTRFAIWFSVKTLRTSKLDTTLANEPFTPISNWNSASPNPTILHQNVTLMTKMEIMKNWTWHCSVFCGTSWSKNKTEMLPVQTTHNCKHK